MLTILISFFYSFYCWLEILSITTCFQVSSHQLRNPTQRKQRGNKGQLEALGVKESLTFADSYVEDPWGIARWLTNKSTSYFVVILSTENPLTGSSVIKAISKTHSNEKKGLISPAYPLSIAMRTHEDNYYRAQWILWTVKKVNWEIRPKKVLEYLAEQNGWYKTWSLLKKWGVINRDFIISWRKPSATHQPNSAVRL